MPQKRRMGDDDEWLRKSAHEIIHCAHVLSCVCAWIKANIDSVLNGFQFRMRMYCSCASNSRSCRKRCNHLARLVHRLTAHMCCGGEHVLTGTLIDVSIHAYSTGRLVQIHYWRNWRYYPSHPLVTHAFRICGAAWLQIMIYFLDEFQRRLWSRALFEMKFQSFQSFPPSPNGYRQMECFARVSDHLLRLRSH